MALQYEEHPVESGVPIPERGAGQGRNQRLAAKLSVGDSVLIEEGRAAALQQCIKKLGGKAITEDAGLQPAADKFRGGEMIPHRRVWRVS